MARALTLITLVALGSCAEDRGVKAHRQLMGIKEFYIAHPPSEPCYWEANGQRIFIPTKKNPGS